MSRIARNGRHSSITPIHEVPVDCREFAAFSMAGQVPGLPGSDAFVDRIKALVDDVTSAPIKVMFIGFPMLGREKTPIRTGPDQPDRE